MPLEEYRAKRKFDETPEPSGANATKPGKSLRFVIQKHQATQLHYDFRLELDGVMLSWAVPKGPSLDPKDKRLAMMVEDHPLDYRNFEGTIPEGNYGAGTVMIWDEGTYSPSLAGSGDDEAAAVRAGLKKGDLKIRLNGKKLNGEYALVRIKDRSAKPGSARKEAKTWLLIKHKDEFAGEIIQHDDRSVRTGRTLEEIAEKAKSNDKITWEDNTPETPSQPVKAKLPTEVKPMLATLVDENFSDPNWAYELKWDGYRALAEVRNGKVKLYSRNGLDFSEKYKPITDALKKLSGKMLLDGEVVVVDDEGVSSFQYLQQYKSDPNRHLIYYVFDILYFDNFDLRDLSWSERRKLLEEVIKPYGNIQISEIYQDSEGLLKQVQKLGFEGIIAKKMSSRYSGGRSDEWLKIKVANEQEFVIGGYTKPQGNREGFGSLLLGEFRKNKFEYVGHVGTGFNDESLLELKAKLDRLKVSKSPFETNHLLKESNVTCWAKPELVAQIKFGEWTEDKMLRHPVFLGLREDKRAREVKPEPMLDIEGDPELKFSNTDKVYWPEDGYTKKDLIEYYEGISEIMLPYLVDRPQNLNRHPNGIHGNSFYHKDFEQKHPEFVKTYDIYSESADKEISYVLVQNKETLLYLANLGCIEINPWNSRIGSLDNPDYLIFDLDPAELEYKEVIKVALRLHSLLDELDLPNYCKTSGKRGLHVFVPLAAKYNFEQTRLFAKLIALQIEQMLPTTVSLERSPKDRRGKIYIDYLQNRIGQTTVGVYSARPVEKAPVSTPLHWDEVKPSLNPKRYTIKTTLKRVEKEGDLWRPVLNEGADIEKALGSLEIN